MLSLCIKLGMIKLLIGRSVPTRSKKCKCDQVNYSVNHGNSVSHNQNITYDNGASVQATKMKLTRVVNIVTVSVVLERQSTGTVNWREKNETLNTAEL